MSYAASTHNFAGLGMLCNASGGALPFSSQVQPHPVCHTHFLPAPFTLIEVTISEAKTYRGYILSILFF